MLEAPKPNRSDRAAEPCELARGSLPGAKPARIPNTAKEITARLLALLQADIDRNYLEEFSAVLPVPHPGGCSAHRLDAWVDRLRRQLAEDRSIPSAELDFSGLQPSDFQIARSALTAKQTRPREISRCFLQALDRLGKCRDDAAHYGPRTTQTAVDEALRGAYRTAAEMEIFSLQMVLSAMLIWRRSGINFEFQNFSFDLDREHTIKTPSLRVSSAGSHMINRFNRELSSFQHSPVDFSFAPISWFTGARGAYHREGRKLLTGLEFAAFPSLTHQVVVHELLHCLIDNLVRDGEVSPFWKGRLQPWSCLSTLPIEKRAYAEGQPVDELITFTLTALRALDGLLCPALQQRMTGAERSRRLLELRQIAGVGAAVAGRSVICLRLIAEQFRREQGFASYSVGGEPHYRLRVGPEASGRDDVRFDLIVPRTAEFSFTAKEEQRASRLSLERHSFIDAELQNLTAVSRKASECLGKVQGVLDACPELEYTALRGAAGLRRELRQWGRGCGFPIEVDSFLYPD